MVRYSYNLLNTFRMQMSQLVKMGFSEVQADIYMALLALGKTTPKELLGRISATKTTLYKVLDEFEKHHLVEKQKEGSKTFLVLQNPKRLEDFLIRQKNRAQESALEQMRTYEDIASDLALSYEKVMGKPDVRILEGQKGIDEAQRIIFSSKSKHLYEISNLDDNMAPDKIRAERRKKFAKAGITVETIYTGTKKLPAKEGPVTRYYLPPNQALNIRGGLFIIDDLFWINVGRPNLFIVFIKNKKVVETYKFIFNLLKSLAIESQKKASRQK